MPAVTMQPRRVTVADADPSPSAYPVELSVEMLRERATPFVPPRLEVTVANPDGPGLDLYVGWPGVFDAIWSEETPGLLLVQPFSNHPRDTMCPRPIQAFPKPLSGHPLRLPPNSRESVTFHVWAKYENDREVCYPEGTYTFTTTYKGADDHEEKFDWGFTLRVETED